METFISVPVKLSFPFRSSRTAKFISTCLYLLHFLLLISYSFLPEKCWLFIACSFLEEKRFQARKERAYKGDGGSYSQEQWKGRLCKRAECSGHPYQTAHHLHSHVRDCLSKPAMNYCWTIKRPTEKAATNNPRWEMESLIRFCWWVLLLAIKDFNYI